ncbi:hypothetical protein I317_07467 [Kwoniella heveanensis CBS 569]|nr:hypothetical protein I317_07467 [Kwoniella heveanensis CBS 569]
MNTGLSLKRVSCATCRLRAAASLRSSVASTSTLASLSPSSSSSAHDEKLHHSGASRSSSGTSSAAARFSGRSIIFTSPIFNPPPAHNRSAAKDARGSANTDRVRPLRYHLRDIEHAHDGHGGSGKVDHGIYGAPYGAVSKKEMHSDEAGTALFWTLTSPAFLVNLRPTYIPPSPSSVSPLTPPPSSSLQLLPDRVATPARLKKGKGFWVSCHQDIVDHLTGSKGPHVGVLRQIPNLQVPRNLRDIIHAQLLQRVLYELDLLFRRLKVHTKKVKNRVLPSSATIKGESHPEGRAGLEMSDVVVRRLTMEEADRIATAQSVKGIRSPLEVGARGERSNVVALLDMAELGNGKTEEKAGQIDIPLIPIHQSISADHNNTVSSATAPMSRTEGSESIAPIQGIPLYSLAHLFPVDLHPRLLELIDGLLATEATHVRRSAYLSSRRAQHHSSPQASAARHLGDSQDQPLSNILAIHYTPRSDGLVDDSDESTQYRSDDKAKVSIVDGAGGRGGEVDNYRRGELGADLAIALWRIRCYFGQGWEVKLPASRR